MDKVQFKQLFQDKVLVLDGASGTQMMNRGMPKGACPEKWAIENPGALISMQTSYIEAGSHVVYTFTLGANRLKLDMHGFGSETRLMNEKLARISRDAAKDIAFVAGDIGPCGKMILPYGDTEFTVVVDSFKEQVLGLLDGGVDFFVIETMMDIQEARAAILAVKECCDLPVMVTMTFEDNMRTLTGTDPVSAITILQAIGADAVGANCSTGPIEMVSVIKAMKPYAQVPIIAKPNAGKPIYTDGKTVFDMNADRFVSFVPELLSAGVNAIGGCCGSDPSFIAALSKQLDLDSSNTSEPSGAVVLSSGRKTVQLFPQLRTIKIGKRLYTTEENSYLQFLKNADMDEIFDLAREDMEDDADILMIRVEGKNIDEVVLLKEVVQTVSGAVALPLCIASSHSAAIEQALRYYTGRAAILVESLSEAVTTGVDKVAIKYGAVLVREYENTLMVV